MPKGKETIHDKKYLKKLANRNKVKKGGKKKRQYPPGPINATGYVGFGRQDGLVANHRKVKIYF